STAQELAQLGFRRTRVRIMTMGSASRPLAALTDSRPKEAVFTILMIGPRRAKRPQHTLRAFELFQQRYPEAQFWVVGWGTDEAKLRRLVEKHSIQKVTFWGRVSEDQRNELLQRAHVLCTSSLREGWGLVVTEANAMGTPVIGYDVPGLRDALAFNNGWLCAPTPQHMADKLEEVFELWSANRPGYERLCQQCLASAKNFSFDHTYEQFAALLPDTK
ncbi:MAG: glycosyltransferase, partial [Kiritimatiellaeota bacterium]|nr:glycosyltransferase [Kiritimatiellota bacterium]